MFQEIPVPNFKCVSVLGKYKCNCSSLLNKRLIHVIFSSCQTCVQSDFKMVRLGPSVKMKISTGSEPAISRSADVCPPNCAIRTFKSFYFAPLIYAWNKLISGKKASKIYYMEDFHLQFPRTDFHLEFGTGLLLVFCFFDYHQDIFYYSAFHWLIVVMIQYANFDKIISRILRRGFEKVLGYDWVKVWSWT